MHQLQKVLNLNSQHQIQHLHHLMEVKIKVKRQQALKKKLKI
jgi:hypothetical protein